MNNLEEKIERLLVELTLDEKIGMIHGNGLFRTEGVPRLGIPPLKMSDGPMGVRQEFENASWNPVGLTDDYVTYLPCNSALAATWNRELAHRLGQVLGEEARGRGKDVILAPGVNILRSPLCGRNFEYMSEDPYLTAQTAVPLIKGIQESDVAACVKHFALNNQETQRLWVDVKVDDRALHEIYLPAFRAAVLEGGSLSLMGAYNLVRGEHCCQSKFLLNQILRRDWGYDGCVISDWGAVHDTKLAAEAGLDIEMSVTYNFDDYFLAEPLKQAVLSGEIDIALVDEKVKNVLRLMARLNMLGGERKKGAYNTPAHRQTVLEVARESVVLLKNEGGMLPLNPDKLRKILIIGDNGERIHSNGGGSAEIKALYEISPLMGMKMKLGGNCEVAFARGYYIPPKQEQDGANWQETSLEDRAAAGLEAPDAVDQTAVSHTAAANHGTSSERDGTADPAIQDKGQLTRQELQDKAGFTMQDRLLEEAVRMAKEADAVIFIGGLNHDQDSEGLDRADMKLPYGQDRLIREVLKVRPDTVIVIMGGSPVEMDAWIDEAQAVLWHWYAGMEGGTALAEALLGEINPSGKLNTTFPRRLEDCPAHKIGEFPGGESVDYKESIYVGYRYYDTWKVPVQFAFGHGLSYTTFEYSDIRVQQASDRDGGLEVSCRIRNTGRMAGGEAVQLYVSAKEAAEEAPFSMNLKTSPAPRPDQELKGYHKVFLQPGEAQQILFSLDTADFSCYDTGSGRFIVDRDCFELRIGSSSRDIRLTAAIQLSGA